MCIRDSSMGKDYIYIWEKQAGMLHENDGARILCGLDVYKRQRL